MKSKIQKILNIQVIMIHMNDFQKDFLIVNIYGIIIIIFIF